MHSAFCTRLLKFMKTVTLTISGVSDSFTIPPRTLVIGPTPDQVIAILASLGVDIVTASEGTMSDVLLKIKIEPTKRIYCAP